MLIWQPQAINGDPPDAFKANEIKGWGQLRSPELGPPPEPRFPVLTRDASRSSETHTKADSRCLGTVTKLIETMEETMFFQ
ncbi:hypothetical protein N7539_001897 [Penicillium diatomitis]|uniref:Uncharacterized protein n=1 Tax=Penicillium diatomitis TaxID=2819901 RepID=A0A9X0C0B5_9EURO|nr:uncharacterized protein N7539_001897 [Penicillium diatomitis]KAJ5493151.1 hypothetical protein N7539_001897 [Penicillium diatomitis]